MLDRFRLGIWNGGPIPFGFNGDRTTISVNGKDKAVSVLVPDETEAEYVRQFYSWYLEPQGSYLSNTKKANGLGIPTKSGKAWNPNQMQRIMKNPLYCVADQAAYEYFSALGIDMACEQSDFDGIHGLMWYNRRKPHKKTTRLKDQSEWVLTVGGHQGIIPGEHFIRAQKKVVATTFKPARAGTGSKGLLASLIKCGKCGKSMVYLDYGQGNWQYYKCRSKEQQGACICSGQTVKGDELDQAVINAIKNVCTDTAFLEDVARQAIKNTVDNTEPLLMDKRRLTERLETFAAEQKELVRALGKKTMPIELIEGRIQEIEREKAPVLKQLEEAELKLNGQDLQKIDMEMVFGNLLRFNEVYDEMEFEEKRIFLRSIVKEIIYTDGLIRLLIYFLPEITPGIPSGKDDNSDTSIMHGCPLIPEVQGGHFSLTIYIEDNSPENSLGQRLRKARCLKGLQVREVASAAEICNHTLSGWENDKHKPTQPGKLKKVARALGITMEYLLDPLPEQTSFGEKLVYYRWCRGWTQKEMANKLGISDDYLGDAEKGKYIAYIHRKAATLDEGFFGPILN
jgi:site-specific DNA recombinase